MQAHVLDRRWVNDAHLVFGRAVAADRDGVAEGPLYSGKGVRDRVGAIDHQFFARVGCCRARVAHDASAARLVASKMHVQGGVVALDDFEVAGVDGD